MKNAILSVMLTLGLVGSASADPVKKLYLRGELLKGGDSVLRFADAVRSGEDSTLSSLIQNTYLNAAAAPESNTKLIPWPYFTGVMLKVNPMMAGDGSVLLTLHGFQSYLSGMKKNPAHQDLEIPEIIYQKISARNILDQGVQKDIMLGNCPTPDKKTTDCTYTLRITVTKQ